MHRKELLIGLMVGALVVYIGASFVTEKKMATVKEVLTREASAQEENAVEITKLLARGDVTSAVAALVPECPVDEMIAYDSLLSALDKGLSYPELVKLNTLFDACGDVAAKRRAVMTIVLEERVAALAAFAEARSVMEEVDSKRVTRWQELAKKEQAISELFIRLVAAQESIIVALLKNVPATSITVENIRASAQSYREEMMTLTTEVGALRAELVSS